METRQDFMDFFRNDELLNTLSADDRLEIFMSILLGGSDLDVDTLNNLIANYSMDGYIKCITCPFELTTKTEEYELQNMLNWWMTDSNINKPLPDTFIIHDMRHERMMEIHVDAHESNYSIEYMQDKDDEANNAMLTFDSLADVTKYIINNSYPFSL